jgi:hypothetical protein
LATLMSVVLGCCVILAASRYKGGPKRAPWALVVAVTMTLMCLQIGYLAAPLTLRAEGEWWRWALVSMAPPALMSLLTLAGNLVRAVRQGVVDRRPATLRPVLTGLLVLQAAMYVGAPVVLWLARSPQGG